MIVLKDLGLARKESTRDLPIGGGAGFHAGLEGELAGRNLELIPVGPHILLIFMAAMPLQLPPFAPQVPTATCRACA